MNDGAPERENAQNGDDTFDPQALLESMRAEYWEAVEKAPEAEPEDLISLLVFRVGPERFALPVEDVREITRVPPLIARVPRGADFLLGVMNLRGQIVPVLDLRSMLGQPQGGGKATARVVVLRGSEGDLGVLAEVVSGLRDLPASDLMAPLNVEISLPPSFVKAQAKDAEGIIAVLDLQAFLTLDSLGT
ncbi:MAG: chemotaxis protein CheW [Planctomycetota bacterium]|jgi:chemotaxis signal transduction protein